MCKFKSGLIFKNRVVIAEGTNDSHSDLLKALGIEDTRENAMRMFVRAELLPPQNKTRNNTRNTRHTVIAWWTSPRTWEFNVDQDILPDWFIEDENKYKEMFIAAVEDWCKEHVLVEKEIGELPRGYYMLKDCIIKEIGRDVMAELNNSNVEYMCNNSTVGSMYGKSKVGAMVDKSRIIYMLDESKVEYICDKSRIAAMYDNSIVGTMNNNSIVEARYDNSKIEIMCDKSSVGTNQE